MQRVGHEWRDLALTHRWEHTIVPENRWNFVAYPGCWSIAFMPPSWVWSPRELLTARPDWSTHQFWPSLLLNPPDFDMFIILELLWALGLFGNRLLDYAQALLDTGCRVLSANAWTLITVGQAFLLDLLLSMSWWLSIIGPDCPPVHENTDVSTSPLASQETPRAFIFGPAGLCWLTCLQRNQSHSYGSRNQVCILKLIWKKGNNAEVNLFAKFLKSHYLDQKKTEGSRIFKCLYSHVFSHILVSQQWWV